MLRNSKLDFNKQLVFLLNRINLRKVVVSSAVIGATLVFFPSIFARALGIITTIIAVGLIPYRDHLNRNASPSFEICRLFFFKNEMYLALKIFSPFGMNFDVTLKKENGHRIYFTPLSKLVVKYQASSGELGRMIYIKLLNTTIHEILSKSHYDPVNGISIPGTIKSKETLNFNHKHQLICDVTALSTFHTNDRSLTSLDQRVFEIGDREEDSLLNVRYYNLLTKVKPRRITVSHRIDLNDLKDPTKNHP